MSSSSHSSSPEWHPTGADKSVYAGEVLAGVSGGQIVGKEFVRPRKRTIDVDTLFDGVVKGNRASLARAITLIESEAVHHKAAARELLRRCLPLSGKSIRVGITGVPGAGKSQFMECIGTKLCDKGKRVAVLAVDPSSSVTGGSILGDKTRMEKLSRLEAAFIRPSPSSGTLGGVAAKTRESMIVCEAAGYEVILVETVGVGQSEIAVRSMVDFFLLIQLAGAGDELQGIKKGVIEMADAIVVNKADGDNVARANLARGEYARVLHHLHPYTKDWEPRALTMSGLYGTGVDEIWEMITEFCQKLKEEDRFQSIRSLQNVKWFRTLLEESVLHAFYSRESVKAKLKELDELVSGGRIPVVEAVEKLIFVD